MKRALEEESSAAALLAAIPTADTSNLSVAGKFGFAKKSDGGETSTDLSAAPNCFLGLTFVFTGVFTEIDRSALEYFAKSHGAKVTSSISGKTSALVVGASDVGPSKIAKAKEKGVKIIDEQGFISLVEQLPEGGGSDAAAKRARAKQQEEEELVQAQAKKFKQEEQAKSKTEPSSQIKSESPESDLYSHRETELWTSKYAPKQMSDICGNPGVVKKLSNWLKNWRKNQKNGFKSGTDGSEFRAAMIHGAPGIGKTTAAHIVAALEGYDIIEYNASDTRSKKLLQEHVANTLSNTSLAGFMGNKRSDKPICIIMDEVDGMSAGDRGGVGQMAQFARKTNVPLIMICNERTLPKMRPFDKVCFELPFRRPDPKSIRNRVQSIALAENLQIDGPTLDQLASQTRSDIRQMINLLSTYATSKDSMSSEQGKNFAKSWEKESALKPFDIVQKYFNPATWRDHDIDSKIELYFNDYAFAPLMVQENYLNTTPRGDALKQAVKAAESISDGDLVDRFIHGSEQHWSLMPLHAVLSCVVPSFFVNGPGRGQLAFSAWLGNNSKSGKYKRLLAELESHTRLRVWAGSRTLRCEFIMDFVEMLITPLKQKGNDAIGQIIDVMDEYYMTREDYDVIMELPVGSQNNVEAIYKSIPTATKTAFTRKYNTTSHPVPFMKFVDTKSVAKKEPLPDLDGVVADDMEAEPEVEEVTLETELAKDKYIKAKKKPAAKKATAKAPAKPRKAPAKKAAAKK